MRADKKFARQLRQDLDVAEDIAAGKIRLGFFIRAAQERFDHAAADDVESIAGIAGCVDRLARPQVPDLGKLSDRFPLERLERRAKAKEILVGHRHVSVAGLVLSGAGAAPACISVVRR